MEYKFKQENYDFWLERFKKNSPNKVCSNDIGLDAFESQQILSKISDYKSVLEIGCGNGLLYEELRKSYKLSKFVGTDFVDELVKECASKKIDNNDIFIQLDMTEVAQNTFNSKFDFVISKRAIQNVLDHSLQMEAIDNFGYFLNDDGLMILVESSNDALQKINLEREKYGLQRIYAPFHNLFFDDELILNYDFKNVKLKSIDPFASDFYFITRIIYARYAREYLKEDPYYDHPMQKIALTMMGKQITTFFSQIKCYIFEKI
tara:strand:+ start:338 stop:1123 length:786 start_codon:yes stop_codon:yes gene_type:complete